MVTQITTEHETLQTFEVLESRVRSYSRSFPTVFATARGYQLQDTEGREYLDFFCGAGALNYGHNNPLIKARLLDYILNDGITHSLDMATSAKEEFLRRFHDCILAPRKMSYKVMFPGPTGTNSVESALKLARKVTGRQSIVSFTNAFHGMTLGSLALCGNSFLRSGAGIPLHYGIHMPYENYLGPWTDSLNYFRRFLEDGGSGVDLPAAVILETVQGEGGVNVASFDWLRKVEEICRQYGMLLIVDEVQVGCGRTGPFFSFEPAGINPDIICLSKSISGYGLPLALTLIKPEHDLWQPGEHNGTFRGNNLAFIAATEALRYWETEDFSREVKRLGQRTMSFLHKLVDVYPEALSQARGRGLMLGLVCEIEGFAKQVSARAFAKGLLVETAGPKNEVVKLMPPLIIDEQGLDRGLAILAESVAECHDKWLDS